MKINCIIKLFMFSNLSLQRFVVFVESVCVKYLPIYGISASCSYKEVSVEDFCVCTHVR